MSDAHANSSENLDEPELEEAEGEQPEAENEPEGEDGGEAETAELEPELEDEPEQRRETRGQPSREHRDRRVTEEERIERIVQRRLDAERQQSRPNVDFQQQQRDLAQRRASEIEQARLNGNEAEVQARHLREDYQADMRARDIQRANERFQDRFDRLCERNSVYNSIRDDVDREAQRLRSQGVFAPDLEIIANGLLGKRYAERATRQGNQQRRNAADGVRRQTVRARSAPSSDQPAPRRGGRRSFNELSAEEMEQQMGDKPVRGTSIT